MGADVDANEWDSGGEIVLGLVLVLGNLRAPPWPIWSKPSLGKYYAVAGQTLPIEHEDEHEHE